MKLRSQCALCLVASVGFFAACGDDDSPPPAGTGGIGGGGGNTAGGSKATGGASATGGLKATGGAGGGPSTGGTTATGGASSGGAAAGTGGAATGGASSGGAASGGTSSGGAASGGASSGGAASGGASSGGAASGGASSGGAASGGASTGGTDSGAPDSGDGDASVDPPPNTVFINEIESNNGDPDDWIELYNTGSAAADISGWIIRDSEDANTYTFPSGTMVPATGVLVINRVPPATVGIGFGLSATDAVRLFNGTTVVDSYSWTSHAAGTYRRCPDGTGPFADGTSSKGAANICQ